MPIQRLLIHDNRQSIPIRNGTKSIALLNDLTTSKSIFPPHLPAQLIGRLGDSHTSIHLAASCSHGNVIRHWLCAFFMNCRETGTSRQRTSRIVLNYKSVEAGTRLQTRRARHDCVLKKRSDEPRHFKDLPAEIAAKLQLAAFPKLPAVRAWGLFFKNQ